MFDSYPDTQLFSELASVNRIQRLILQIDWTSSIIYDSASPFAEPAILDSYDDFNDLALVPLQVQPSEPADVSFPLIVNFDTYSDGTNRGTFVSFNVLLPDLNLIREVERYSLQCTESTCPIYCPHDGRRCTET